MTDDAPKTPASYWADQIRADLRRRRETESETSRDQEEQP